MPLVQAMQAALLSRQVLHVDETPVSMLSPGKGKTHRAYLWSYCTTAYDPIAAVVFDFADSRAGKHAREFLGFDDERPELGWRGTLVCDDYSGYKALFPKGVTEAGCLAHARRNFFDLWANHKSAIAEEAIKLFARLYEIEAALKDLDPEERRRCRQQDAKPAAETLHRRLARRLAASHPDASQTIGSLTAPPKSDCLTNSLSFQTPFFGGAGDSNYPPLNRSAFDSRETPATPISSQQSCRSIAHTAT